jgi:membrane-associated protease RseP (regulator of RpoE activity)
MARGGGGTRSLFSMAEQYPISTFEQFPEPPAYAAFAPRPKFQDRRWLHLLLFVLTFLSTTAIGVDRHLAFLSPYGSPPPVLHWPSVLLHGLWYSGTILLILGAHEMGHYLACRYYQVDASLPFFLPMPLVLTGTLGAFIKIREPIPTKRMLFDIGAGGPFAGFLVALPALFIGVGMSHVMKVPTSPLPPGIISYELGEPLLFRAASWLVWGHIPDGYSLNLHPMAFAAWFGLLATALNLFPIGQLDGGHISYAVLGRRSSVITLSSIGVALCLTFFSRSWLVWTFMIVAMTVTMGPHHPRTLDEHVPLDRTRIWLALAAAVIFILCFTYSPIESSELLK